MRGVAALVLLFGLRIGAQEFPSSPTPTAFDCTSGCGLEPARGVRCSAWVHLASGAQGPRCRAYCQYEGMPYFNPGPGWQACSSFAPAGLACNATEYVYPPPPGRTRPQLVCDAGTADGLVGAP